MGLFKIDLVIPRSKIIFEDYAIEAFQEYDFYKVVLNEPNTFNKTPWVKGIEEESGLLEKAVPLSSPQDPEKWSDLACKLFRTSTGRRLDVNQKAKFNWVLKCEDECLDELLTRCAFRR